MEGRPRDTLQYKPDLECKKVLKKLTWLENPRICQFTG